MRRSKRGGIVVCIAASAAMNACQIIPTSHEAEPPPELLQHVSAYLQADDQEAESLLPALSDRPIAELESALLLTLDSSFQKSVPTGMQRGRSIRVGDDSMRYGLYVPPAYDPSRSYPLILCLHGAGFDGDAYLDRWQPRLGEDYLLACPTMEEGEWWTRQGEALVLAVLSDISRTYHVDPDRVFLTGMSNGGIGTYLIGLNHPDRFAALIPMAGAFPTALFPLLDNAKNTPLYIIHGSKDQVMPVQYSRDVAAYLKRNGYPVIYREHDRVHPMAGGHYFPREELPDLLAWLKTQRRTSEPREPVVVRDRDHPGRDFWVRIDEIDSAAGSFWESEHHPGESRRLQQGAYARLKAQVSGNTIFMTTEHILRYSVLIPRHLVDLNKPVLVFTNGRVSFEQLLRPDGRSLLEEARRRPDPRQLVFSTIEIRVSP
ncbi:MAG: prolyl oligopeptidase family serine peptidase [Nitrospirae bacterium]|nr:prolyl oligopeptidase family serine peptidase [Nitrospirota bacterium]